jgi:hypothetical protein
VGGFKSNLHVILGCERLAVNPDDAVSSGRKVMFIPIKVEK